MSSISRHLRSSRPPLVRLRQRPVPALPACHISANLRARARSHARRIRPSMCEARATARAPRYRCIRDLCSPCLLPSLRTSSCGCSLVAGCVAADLRLEQTADCVQALVSGVMLEFGGHVAELWWKRTRRSLARTPMCGGSACVACRRDRGTGRARRPVPLCTAQSAQWRSCAAEGRPRILFGQRACICWCGAGRAPHRHVCVHVRCRWVHSVMDLMVRIVS